MIYAKDSSAAKKAKLSINIATVHYLALFEN